MIGVFDTADDVVRAGAPDAPTALCRPHAAAEAARWFASAMPGRALYAVKANPAPWLLEAVHGAGVIAFDVASRAECEAVNALPGRELMYMHPVKSRRAIAAAYHDYGCRVFALDSLDELAKIAAETGGARDVTLIVRIAVPNVGSVLPIEGKFGATVFDAPDLLRAARRTGARLGASFHVGSQCMDPAAFQKAVRETNQLATLAGVTLDVLNVGGGFPVRYPGLVPPPMPAYAEAIAAAVREDLTSAPDAELWLEPGRAIAAGAESVLVRVELRKADALFLNDGGFGHLYDAAHEAWRFPVRLVRPGGASRAPVRAFRAFGPTCDAADAMAGPFTLPDDVGEGDLLEVGLVGAYGRTMRAPFNGFGAFEEALVRDTPWPALVVDETADPEALTPAHLGA